MARLLELPIELLVDILSRLEQTDRKRFRRASRLCERLTTPLIFDTVAFDLEPGGCDGLTSIANNPVLRRHVGTLHLQRRRGLRYFADFEDWQYSNIHEYIPWPEEDKDEHAPTSHTAVPMSRDEWDALDHDRRRDLYEQYKSDESEIEACASRLASAVSLLMLPGSTARSQVQHSASDAQRMLDDFTSAITALSNVHTFAYTPSYEFDQWGRTWRDVEFHPAALPNFADHGNNPDIDALQLFVSLRPVLQAPNALRSVALFTWENAFWSVPNLRRLLDWKQPSTHLWPDLDTAGAGVESWMDDIGGPLALIEHTEALTRELVALERGFSRLTSFECRVNASWSTGRNWRMIAAKAVSNILRETVELNQLTLVVRPGAVRDNIITYTYFDFEFNPEIFEIPAGKRRKEYIEASKQLLLSSAPVLQHLRRLHLSLVTDIAHLLPFFSCLHHLRHLQLDHMALVPNGGRWETVLAWIAQHLHLDFIDLTDLEDVCEDQPRLILCPESPEWVTAESDDDDDDDGYDEYEAAIICYTLRLSNTLPALSPTEFLQNRSQHQMESSSDSCSEDSIVNDAMT